MTPAGSQTGGRCSRSFRTLTHIRLGGERALLSSGTAAAADRPFWAAPQPCPLLLPPGARGAFSGAPLGLQESDLKQLLPSLAPIIMVPAAILLN